MEFRRSGQRDDRRRRVLMDEKLASPDENDEAVPPRSRKAAAGGSSNGRKYSDAALYERQPRVVDFLPTRLWSLSVLVLLALTCVAALAAAHVHTPDLRQFLARAELASLDLSGPSSIGAW